MRKLHDIAEDLRRKALANAGENQSEPLGHGAHCNLRADVQDPPMIVDPLDDAGNQYRVEWHLQIQRDGKLPAEDTPAYKRWLAELGTFRKPEYFNVPPETKEQMTSGTRTYAANFVWTEMVEIRTPIAKRARVEIKAHPIPQNEAEMEAWARTLGPGVRLTRVDVFTGEL